MQYQFSQTESAICGSGLTMNGRLPPPIDELCGLDAISCFPFPHHGSEYEACSPSVQLSLMRARHDILCLHKGAEVYPL